MYFNYIFYWVIWQVINYNFAQVIVICRGRVDDLSFFEYLSPFCFLSIELHCSFSISYKYYHILFIIIIFWLGCDRPSGLLFFVPALLLSRLTPLCLPFSSVSLSYFVHAVPMRECFGKHLWGVIAEVIVCKLMLKNNYNLSTLYRARI